MINSISIFYGHNLSQIFSAKEEKEEIKREAVDRQALLKQQMDSRKNHHRDIMKKKMQERKRKKIGSLPEKHARETAKVRQHSELFSISILSFAHKPYINNLIHQTICYNFNDRNTHDISAEKRTVVDIIFISLLTIHTCIIFILFFPIITIGTSYQ